MQAGRSNAWGVSMGAKGSRMEAHREPARMLEVLGELGAARTPQGNRHGGGEDERAVVSARGLLE